MRLRQILTEILWTEQYSAMTIAKNYPYDWIHFTNIPKLGINPSKKHKDPPGIYFYPIKWLLRIYDDDGPNLSMYGTHLPYFYICKIQSANMLVLNTMTRAKITNIANRNGWSKDLQDIQNHPEVLNNINNPMNKKTLRTVGGFFYSCLDYLVNVKGEKSWLQLLNGIDGLIDRGAGIISAGEAWQSVVFKRDNIKILKFGENKDQSLSIYAQAAQIVAKQLNGKFFFKNKVPGFNAEVNGIPITVYYDPGNWALHIEYYNKNGHWIKETKRIYEGSTGDLESLTKDLSYIVLNTIHGDASEFSKASSRTQEHYWDQKTIMMLISKLMSSNVYRYIRTYPSSEGIMYSVHIDSYFNQYLNLNIIGDKVIVNIEIEISINYNRTIIKTPPDGFILTPTTDIQTAANKILDILAKMIRVKYKDEAPMLVKRLNFNLQSRFN